MDSDVIRWQEARCQEFRGLHFWQKRPVGVIVGRCAPRHRLPDGCPTAARRLPDG